MNQIKKEVDEIEKITKPNTTPQDLNKAADKLLQEINQLSSIPLYQARLDNLKN